MKKMFIYLFLCLLGSLSFGQGTAYITQSGLVGYPEIIRQYDNLPGHHVIYYKDAPSGIKGYVGLTDVYNIEFEMVPIIPDDRSSFNSIPTSYNIPGPLCLPSMTRRVL